MDRSRPYKSVLLNLPVAGDVDVANYPGEVWIKGLLPFKTGQYVSYKTQVSVAEVTQILTLGVATVVTASTTYRILLGNTSDRDADWHTNLRPVGYKSPAILGASAQVDRMNMYLSMAARANSPYAQPLNYFCGARVKLTHVASTLFTLPTGYNNGWDGTPAWVTGSISGTIGFIHTQADSTAILTNLNVTNGILPVAGDILTVIASPFNPNVIATGGPSTATVIGATATDLGLGLVIQDKPLYYNAFGNRHGASSYYASAGFASTAFTVTQAAVYQIGQGYALALLVPRVETTSSNFLAGTQPWFPTNEAPNPAYVGATAYNIIDIYYKPEMNASAIEDNTDSGLAYQRIYAYNTAAGYAAFLAEIVAL
jgi:hypothetical protein